MTVPTPAPPLSSEPLRERIAVAQPQVVPISGSQRAVDVVMQLVEIEQEFTEKGYFWPHERSVREIAETVGSEFLLLAEHQN